MIERSKYKDFGDLVKSIMERNQIKTTGIKGVSQSLISQIRTGDKLGGKATLDKIVTAICKTEKEEFEIRKEWSASKGDEKIRDRYDKLEKSASGITELLKKVDGAKDIEELKEVKEIKVAAEFLLKLKDDSRKDILKLIIEKYMSQKLDDEEIDIQEIQELKKLINEL